MFPKVLLVAFTLLVLIVLTLAYNNALGSGNKESLVGGSVKMYNRSPISRRTIHHKVVKRRGHMAGNYSSYHGYNSGCLGL